MLTDVCHGLEFGLSRVWCFRFGLLNCFVWLACRRFVVGGFDCLVLGFGFKLGLACFMVVRWAEWCGLVLVRCGFFAGFMVWFVVVCCLVVCLCVVVFAVLV